ncbi:MAG: glycoside hydrolase family 88 protein [Lachnospiraceae bacterium]|nr:glycoside hydrolase family 88 protein [Lachnospiraceae bacterium]
MNYSDRMDKETSKWLRDVWAKLESKLSAEVDRTGAKIPYIPVDGRYIDMAKENIFWWTNGFYGGMLWQLYHATKDEKYRETALKVGECLDTTLEQPDKLDHDVGFMWLHTAVANYRETGDAAARETGLRAAKLLANRYNPNGKFIKAWNGDRDGWVIIDCLMNLPLLYWATEEIGDNTYRDIAINHTETACREILRKDGSTNHIVVFDTETGEALERPAGQGYASGSSWSRGQAWAVYGMELAYRYTGNEEYLNRSKLAAHYFIANVAMTGFIPVIDFRSPKEPYYNDSTAGVIAACGLLELMNYVDEAEKDFYFDAAIKILKATEAKCANWNEDEDGVIGLGSARYDRELDREKPIIYGDYYFLEAVLRLLDKDIFLW